MKEEVSVQLLLNANTNTNHQHRLNEVDGKPLSSSSSITPTLLLSVFVTVLGSFSCGYTVGYSSPTQAQIMKELDLSTADYSLFGSMLSFGGIFGAIVCGRLADYLGRKHALRLTVLIYIFGWLSIATGQRAWLLDLGRWLLGFSMIIGNYVVPVYIAEFAPKNLRGGFVSLHALMTAVGSSSVFLIGLVTTWRTLALIGTTSSLVQIVGLFFIPESPRWLLMKSKTNAFETALQQLRGGSVVNEAADLRESIEALHQVEKVRFLQLFQKKYAYTLTVGIGLAALQCLVGLNGILFYASSIFKSAGFSATVGTIALALIQLPSVGLGVLLMDKYGRRPLLMISVPGLCLGCFLAGLSFVFQEHRLLDGCSSYMALTGLLFYIASYPVGMGGAASVILSEIYPLNIKGLAGSICSVVLCLAGWIVSYTFNFLMEWSSSGTFFIMAGISAFTIVFVAKLVPETKGRTLEEIHASTSNVWQ
ncbi:sugar transporter ERD6-like 5 [Chenopodium quinoa]|uniref:sugar transporter ERD6-like 5 n=1 Tax=Chenopodium quinoa TaxID=63459 RepID=UPI000B79533E|nr:sugar transporter ERD6-like 5 [Chenopodium quinoa]